MLATTKVITISRPPKDVFKFLCDVSNYSLWQSGLVSAEAVQPLVRGSVIKVTSSNLGRTFDATATVEELEAPSLIRFRSKTGPLTFDITYHLTTEGKNKTKLLAAILVELAASSAWPNQCWNICPEPKLMRT